MRALSPDVPLDTENIEREIVARDRELDNEFSKDLQLTAVRGARKYRGDKLIRVATPHRILDPKAGPLIAVKLHMLTRKSLGGIQTDLDSRALAADGAPCPASTRSARRPASAAAACTATARSRARSSADASSRVARQGARSPGADSGGPAFSGRAFSGDTFAVTPSAVTPSGSRPCAARARARDGS